MATMTRTGVTCAPGKARNRVKLLERRLQQARDGRERLAAAVDHVRATYSAADDDEIDRVIAQLRALTQNEGAPRS